MGFLLQENRALRRFSDAFTIKDVLQYALTLIMDIGMTLVTGTILFRMNINYFLLFIYDISILLVFI